MRLSQLLKRNILFFICYSIVGWLYELTIFAFEEHKLINRGFMLGPWLPIYGFGGIIIYYTAYKYAKKPLDLHIGNSRVNTKPFFMFLIISVSAAAVELISTYILDAFHVDWTALWKYDDYAINFEERIALLPALKFGILGCIIIYFAQDAIEKYVRDETAAQYILIGIFTIDLIFHLVFGSNYTDVPALIL